jgi:hypothetical protein
VLPKTGLSHVGTSGPLGVKTPTLRNLQSFLKKTKYFNF